MDTQKFNIGWAIVTISGLIPNETAKLRRAILSQGAHKLMPGTFAISGVRGQNGLEKLVAKLKEKGTKETTFRAIYVTRAQWDRSFLCHGVAAS